MKEIVAVVNQKGGVSKTSTVLALAAGLKAKRNRILLVDMDAQSNLSYTAGATPTDKTVYRAMVEGSASGMIQSLDYAGERDLYERVDILPAGPDLSGADVNLSGTVGREYLLKEVLKELAEDYDYILIDTPPALGALTVNALTASTGVIITAQADIYSLQGIASLSSTLEAVRKYCNKDLKVKGILITRYNSRSILSRSIAEELAGTAEAMGTVLYQTRIRECTAVKEAQLEKQSIFSYAPRSNAAKDYMAFIEEAFPA